MLARKCTFFGTRTIGNLIVMKEPEIEEVYRMANKASMVSDNL